MSSKNVQTQTNQYDPTSMGAYNTLTQGLSSAVSGYMNNPFGNPFFQQQQQMGMGQANNMNQTGMANLTRNMSMSGMQQNSPAALALMQNQMRAGTANTANLGFMNPTNNALGMQQNAMGLASSYRPLQTGGTQTSTQSGLGSWLPQVAGMAGQIGMGIATGGASMAASPLLSGTSGALGSYYGGMQSPTGGFQGPSQPFQAPSFGMSGGYNMSSSPFLQGYNPQP